MRNFRRIAADLQPIYTELLAALGRRPELWDEITARQDYPGSAHHDTRAIYCWGPAELTPFAVQQDLSVVQYEAARVLYSGLNEVLGGIMGLVRPTQAGRLMLVELKAGGVIDTHADEGAYAEHFSRFHLVLQGSCNFWCGGESVTMYAGELWWFDHRLPHNVTNRGPQPRVNLIFDAVSLEYPVRRPEAQGLALNAS